MSRTARLFACGAAAEATAELATVRERNRLDREIHDGLGQALTALAMQIEQAQSFRTRDAEPADGAVATAKGLADKALSAVRRSVGVLRVLSTALGNRWRRWRPPDETTP